MGNAFKVQIVAGALITLLIFHNLYLKLEKLLETTKAKQSSSVSSKESEGNQVLIYNRVPKTGSTSLMNVAYELYKQNNFRVVQLHVSHFKHILTTGDQARFASNISSWSDSPTLYHGHFAYFDPKRLGVAVTPIFINLIRKPLDRLVSHYYFLRYGDDVLVNKVRAKEGDTTTFDECVQLQQQDCDPKRMWLQIPFFCGTSPQCWELGSQWALSQAKANLVNNYLLVGVTEELDTFVEVLEELLPQFFSGAKQFLEDSGKSHIKHTRHKDPVSEETVSKMKKTKVWQLENDFYNFALKKFNSVKSETFEQKKSQSNFFNYEKVRPKV